MNKLIKPHKQSYTGDDAQVVAYADICELAWIANICYGAIAAAGLLGFTVPPLAAAMGVSCFVFWIVYSAACNGTI